MRANSDPDVRLAVATGMPGSPREDAITTLIELMDDVNDNVRDWATFGLGTQSDLDTSVIREALRKRLSDSFPDARVEAIWGLAQRKDESGLRMLIDRLSAEECAEGDKMAAAEILNLPNDTPAEQLLDGLRRLLSDHLPR
jgi:HEAT repeat protein